MTSPYHEGEVAVQRHAGTVDQADAMVRTIRSCLPAPLMRFLAERRWIVMGGTDIDGSVWASLLVGEPGFVGAVNDTSVRVQGRPPIGDPLRDVGSRPAGQPTGLLAIDLGRRRRARINGLLHRTADQLVIDVEQVYANCMKYIQRRETIDNGNRRPTPPVHTVCERMTSDHIAAVHAADTLFIATVARNHGADASHRGGPPGFLECSSDGTLIRFADYPGNGMFNTLGNLHLDGRAGLTVPCFDTGTVLQLSGSAAVTRDSGDRRTVNFTVDRVVHCADALPFRFGPVEYSPFLPSAASSWT